MRMCFVRAESAGTDGNCAICPLQKAQFDVHLRWPSFQRIRNACRRRSQDK